MFNLSHLNFDDKIRENIPNRKNSFELIKRHKSEINIPEKVCIYIDIFLQISSLYGDKNRC